MTSVLVTVVAAGSLPAGELVVVVPIVVVVVAPEVAVGGVVVGAFTVTVVSSGTTDDVAGEGLRSVWPPQPASKPVDSAIAIQLLMNGLTLRPG